MKKRKLSGQNKEGHGLGRVNDRLFCHLCNVPILKVSQHLVTNKHQAAHESRKKQRINKNGYAQVNLTQRIGRKQTITVTVHKLVALAFLDKPLANPGKTKGSSRVKHIDGCKTNNCVGNLKWTKIEESDS